MMNVPKGVYMGYQYKGNIEMEKMVLKWMWMEWDGEIECAGVRTITEEREK